MRKRKNDRQGTRGEAGGRKIFGHKTDRLFSYRFHRWAKVYIETDTTLILSTHTQHSDRVSAQCQPGDSPNSHDLKFSSPCVRHFKCRG